MTITHERLMVIANKILKEAKQIDFNNILRASDSLHKRGELTTEDTIIFAQFWNDNVPKISIKNSIFYNTEMPTMFYFPFWVNSYSKFPWKPGDRRGQIAWLKHLIKFYKNKKDGNYDY